MILFTGPEETFGSGTVSNPQSIEWRFIRRMIPNCSEEDCPLEDAVWRYARKNLAMLNIFIKVSTRTNETMALVFSKTYVLNLSHQHDKFLCDIPVITTQLDENRRNFMEHQPFTIYFFL